MVLKVGSSKENIWEDRDAKIIRIVIELISSLLVEKGYSYWLVKIVKKKGGDHGWEYGLKNTEGG